MCGRQRLFSLVLVVLAAGACGKKKEPVLQPAPVDSTPARAAPTGPVTGPAARPDAAAEAERIRAAVAAELGNMIHFDYDQDAIKPEDRPILDHKADILRANPALRIRISGHADERGSDEYNLVLGNKRALAAKRYLEGKGIESSRIEITSYGEERPIDPASNEAAWAKNRRDEFEILAGGDKLVAPK
jgi:peptidoglycan-associated lipoprotein